MGILGWIILGGLAGWLASVVTGNNGSMGILLNIVIGIIGAFLGSFLFSYINGASVTGFNLGRFLATFTGLIRLLFQINLFFNKSRKTNLTKEVSQTC